MNQILNFNDNSPNYSKKGYDFLKNYKTIFLLSIIICIISIIIYFFIRYNVNKNDKFSKELANSFSLSTLYSNSISEYTTQKLEETTTTKEPFVIGLIEIEKIKLIYPILSETTTELLKLSPCRYVGPMPNESGNLCIAGHNYVDNKLFSKLNVLKNGDIIKIYDLTGNYLQYSVFEIKEVPSTDTSCTVQNTDSTKYVTLITCNNVNGLRLIVKCKNIS